MFDKYLELNGVEVINAARFKAYVNGHTPDITVRCEEPNLHLALEQDAYTNPQTDGAPWYRASRLPSTRFFGVFSRGFEGLWDSTRELSVTQLLGNGGVQSLPRDASGEVRVKVLLAAADQEALHEGWIWFRETLYASKCDDASLGCVGVTAKVFIASPQDVNDAEEFARYFYNVELLEGPRVTKEYASKNAAMLEAEFILSIGKPWPFTKQTLIAVLDMDAATNHTDAAGENCSEATVAYDNFITDPFYTAIQLPPRPAAILPPNVLDISSWRRMTTVIPTEFSDRPGMVVPTVRIFTGSYGAQFVRVRFYRDEVAGATGCDYDGEFLVSYVPPNSIMTLDAIRREVGVTMPDGRVVPGGHLLFGTDGRPFEWPELGCHHTYTVTADMMPDQIDVTVHVEVAVRE
jgi:hypothetical protein